MDGNKKLIIAVVVVILLTIVAVVVVRTNNLNFIEETKESTSGKLYFNIYENLQKQEGELNKVYSKYREDFEVEVKKGEQFTLEAMYQKILFTVKKIAMDDTVTIKSTMTFHMNEDYSDPGFQEMTIKPGEELRLYFNGQDNAGYVSIRFEQ